MSDLDLLGLLDKAKAKAAEKGEELLDEKGPGVIDDLLKEGHDLLDVETDGDLAKAGHEALELLGENKTPFLRLGKVGFARLVGHWERADEAEARRHYLTHQATYQERRDAMQRAGDELVDAEDEAKAAWEETKAVLKKVGTLGLKFLVKLAISGLALA